MRDTEYFVSPEISKKGPAPDLQMPNQKTNVGNHAQLFQKSAVTAIRSALPILPFIVFVAHASILKDWIVDDAGISFAYARNLATGHGLVSQPDILPVEGYSNFLWVVLITPFWALGLFHIVWTPKLLSIFLVGLSFGILHRTLRSECELSIGSVVLSMTLTAFQPAFTIWCVSGLENPLNVLLISGLFMVTLADLKGRSKNGLPVQAGALATALAITRPEGLLYGVLYPALHLALARRIRPGWNVCRQMTKYSLTLLILFGAFLIFRWFYFHDILPNTYYAKGGVEFGDVQDLAGRVTDLFRAATSLPGLWVILGLTSATVWIIINKQPNFAIVTLGTFLILSMLPYLLLPQDWMGEFRFATLFFVFVYPFAAGVLHVLHSSRQTRKGFRIYRMYTIAFIIFCAGLYFVYQRTMPFSHKPTVPLKKVVAYYGKGYDRVAEILGVQKGSLLTPDAGGTLLSSHLRIFDLGMMCDRTIARTLLKDKDAFHDYIFRKIRPTFIHCSGVFVGLADLDSDVRFKRDYIPLRSYVGALPNPAYLGIGDYVRRDILEVGGLSLSSKKRDTVIRQLRETLNRMDLDF